LEKTKLSKEEPKVPKVVPLPTDYTPESLKKYVEAIKEAGLLGEPFGGFKDWNACMVHAKADKSITNPEAWCGAVKAKTEKEALKKLEEKIVWIGELDESPDLEWLPDELKEVRPIITGRAIHPVKTYHPHEFPHVRVYLEEELARVAPGYVGTTPYLDHTIPIEGWKVIATKYADGELKYAVIPKEDKVLEIVRNGEIKKTSIEFDWMVPGGGLKFVNGVAPFGFEARHISFLRQMKPGDPSTTVQLWESQIIPGLKTRAMSKIKEGINDDAKKSLSLEEQLEMSLLEDRTIIFHGKVYEEACQRAARRLEFLAKENKDPIHIILNSVGGGVYDGLLVFDTIKTLRDQGIEVICEARGLAASMGSIILQAGTERKATPHTRFLIHEVSTMQWGETTKLEERTEELRKLNNMLNQIYAERTGKSVEEINELTKKTDYWLSAKEALEFGLIDEISEPQPANMGEGRIREYIETRGKIDVGNELMKRLREVGATDSFVEASVKLLQEQIPAQPMVPVGPVTVEQKIAAMNDELAKFGRLLANLYGLTGHPMAEQVPPEDAKVDSHGCRIGEEKWDSDLSQCVKLEKETPESETKELVELRKELVKQEGIINSAKKETETEKKRHQNLRESIIKILPPKMAVRSWSWGPQEFVKQIRHAVGLNPEE